MLKHTTSKPSFSRKKTDQERRNNGTNREAIQRNSGATVAVTKSIIFSRGNLGASPQHYNAVVFVFHFKKIFLFSERASEASVADSQSCSIEISYIYIYI